MYFFISPQGRALSNPQAGGGTYNISATEFHKVKNSLLSISVQRQLISELDVQMEVLGGLNKMTNKAENKIKQILADFWGLELNEKIKEEVDNEE